jgi:hypothetical protein
LCGITATPPKKETALGATETELEQKNVLDVISNLKENIITLAIEQVRCSLYKISAITKGTKYALVL